MRKRLDYIGVRTSKKPSFYPLEHPMCEWPATYMQVIYKICRVLNQYIHKSGKGIILFRFKFRFEHFDLRGGDKATAMQVTSDRFYQTLHKFVQIIIFL